MVVNRLREWAGSRPHVLLIEAPGGAGSRLAVERACRERGWPLAATPADADVLVVAGPAGPVDPYVDRLWDQLPGPRARSRITTAQDVGNALDLARKALLDRAAARADTRSTLRPPAGMPTGGGTGGHDMGEHDADDAADVDTGHDGSENAHAGHDMGSSEDAHAGHDMGSSENAQAGHDMGSSEDAHAGHDMGGHDMSGHEGHDMGGMDMPAGLGMADRADDRDGLKLDVLTVPWGPALPWWPAGLVVITVLQGDVVQQAHAEQLGEPGAGARGWREALAGLSPSAAAAAVRLDALARLLAVAGWDAARLDAERLRDEVLGRADVPDLATRLHRLTRRVGRSRTLSRMSCGLPVAAGDVETTYRGWLQDLTVMADGADPPAWPELAADPLELLTASLIGLEVGTARLVVAALEPQLSGAQQPQATGV